MLVYKQYDRAALDLQFNNRVRVPDHAIHLGRCETMSRQTEKEYSFEKDIPYGNLDRERLDIYPSSQPHSKTLVFIHGGYWQRLDKSTFQFIAGAFHSYGITTVLITYPLGPAVSMDQIVLSCRGAIQWVNENISRYNGDPNQLYLAGHSAGGHLATMMMAADWCHSNKRFPVQMFKGVCAMSGLFNLLPIQLSEINDGLNMSDQTVLCNSPVELHPVCSCPLLLAVGEDESEEFRKQSEELYTCWKEHVPAQLIQLPGINHYSIVEAAADKNSSLHKAICSLMEL
ncbi:MAG: alpha/beta hydrolase [Chitinophagaceae bacterium]